MTRLQERIESFNRAFEILSEAVNAYKNNCMNIGNLDTVQKFWDSSGIFDRTDEKLLNFYFFVNSF